MDGLTAPAGRALLPAEAPLAMPPQFFDRAPPAPPAPTGPPLISVRRALVIGGALALTTAATAEMSLVIGLARWTVSGIALTVLFSLLFLWLALSFTSALAGFAVLLRSARVTPPPHLPRTRTALLMPVYNEDTARVARALAAMRAALADADAADAFDFFLLSDSTDPARRAEEARAVGRLHVVPGPALHYRHRPANTGRKAGNIAEWVRRFGAAYEQFLILDADSVMEASTLLALVAEMERQPDTGLVQTLPLLHGGETLFARLQQFAGQLYGPLIAAGLAWWHGAEGNYWGHNAMIRTRAFAEAAGLPDLPGRPPFGGAILSHDFVEAALLRRAGWAVRMLPLLPGSHEAGPPTLPDMAVRDRRWCQGNLQHAAVLPARGLHWMSRLHMASGIAAYASAPFWLAFLLLGIAVALQARFLRPEYFPAGHTLFPLWPVVDPERALRVFGLTLMVLLAPKLLALAEVLVSARAHAFGGRIRLLASALLEILLSALLSPITMLTQAVQCVSILRGSDAGWQTQRREGDRVTWHNSWRFTRLHVLLGIVLLALSLSVEPLLAAWMAPVLVGLVLAPALVAFSASTAVGRALGRHSLLATPDETAPSPLLRKACQRSANAPPAYHPHYAVPLPESGAAADTATDGAAARQPRPAPACGDAVG